ncbi:hypothetical protein Ae706Ps2_6577c [Pseudonocardia sp. Ae706_Ps2]|nr:hypothetical protein Ae706Ps2_6577c [Pseudonocardia sp. Ae706_Ps2]
MVDSLSGEHDVNAERRALPHDRGDVVPHRWVRRIALLLDLAPQLHGLSREL